MNQKFNKKGQGALEYLLIMGGVVLVGVVVVALLIGTSSENTENAKKQSKEFIATTDVALPSTVLSVICKEKTGVNDEYVVKWNATHKGGYEYTVLFDDKPIIFKDDDPNYNLTPSENPIVFTIESDARFEKDPNLVPILAKCSSIGSEAISIKTTNTENDTTAVSNRVFIKQQAGTVSPISFSPPAGAVDFPAIITLTDNGGSKAGRIIYYTVGLLDSPPADPTVEDTPYNDPFKIGDPSIIKARVYEEKTPVTDVISATYTKQ